MSEEECDYIIAGGGLTGCRLRRAAHCERHQKRVGTGGHVRGPEKQIHQYSRGHPTPLQVPFLLELRDEGREGLKRSERLLRCRSSSSSSCSSTPAWCRTRGRGTSRRCGRWPPRYSRRRTSPILSTRETLFEAVNLIVICGADGPTKLRDGAMRLLGKFISATSAS